MAITIKTYWYEICFSFWFYAEEVCSGSSYGLSGVFPGVCWGDAGDEPCMYPTYSLYHLYSRIGMM